MTLTFCASVGNRHPDYPGAIQDLRAARVLIDQPAHRLRTLDQNDAVVQIDGALREIKYASVEVGVSIEGLPVVDIGSGPSSRFRGALYLLRRARASVDQDEDYYFASRLRSNTLSHIDIAIQDTFRALVE
jgi:hypothetical protein